jgi:hypothetical protein
MINVPYIEHAADKNEQEGTQRCEKVSEILPVQEGDERQPEYCGYI